MRLSVEYRIRVCILNTRSLLRPAFSWLPPTKGIFYRGIKKWQKKYLLMALWLKNPASKPPEWVKCNLSLKREDVISWLSGQTDEWINVQVCESKGGKWYAEVDTWKPSKP